MKIHQVQSSAISSIGYNRPRKQLAVKFNSGHSYIYDKVPPQTYTQLRKADSIGKFFHEHIFGLYEARKIGE
jgi:hypothetical protein